MIKPFVVMDLCVFSSCTAPANDVVYKIWASRKKYLFVHINKANFFFLIPVMEILEAQHSPGISDF